MLSREEKALPLSSAEVIEADTKAARSSCCDLPRDDRPDNSVCRLYKARYVHPTLRLTLTLLPPVAAQHIHFTADAAQVTLRAELFGAETTSHGAAGLWEPYKLGARHAALCRLGGSLVKRALRLVTAPSPVCRVRS